MIDLTKLTTEQRNPNTMDLDILSPLEFAKKMNDEDKKVPEAIEKVLPEIAQAITWGIEALSNGGRIIYMGAGTSGRLGVLDAVECPPTFGVSYDTVVGLIAGGDSAFVKAKEGSEDSLSEGVEDLKRIDANENDLIVGLAASGRTPYVIEALGYANEIGCHTVAIACNKNSEIGAVAKLAIEAVPGPEVLTGSTRLKAGTTQKLILNMISTGAMVGVGKAYENLMVDVKLSNKKLVQRGKNIIKEVTDASDEVIEQAIEASGNRVKVAIVMILHNCDVAKAEALLETSKGHIRNIK
ncbi:MULTISPECIES: N-acetylmuramic acid 6-phosphate etherase [unclassified Breznakia]|uniref:N-acetylmuramic acid 6-phosphate etherase n=1 Tax=unclassified Breznakia TaxID=2623764 RepID=UPI002473DAE0|nr:MULTISPECIES: N-acetylmuramic acid 6-phosphate etherase [unclassified Breznakia]MDH6365928.1 N-acetylmuramic acid 6-phosphate etherase [Breznakia sp. PH1-1]MDH6365933.1 N-acetylmuramic acid 6-phosphate etherase [Breznakia sp. PH1-1]MDH6403135.1 N-acetylmuramic acid 6-phosphate etherase [Breznakia sp. PF1-11]MDH6403140.1 N-acetylmuramic acid 6-phosphate etherase [Breznakia sp. PF1-11]MDH6410844.1 N-acetylmuramic acid 6-phosphate etherase [Breznakia sp. PFB1-11]